MARERRPHIKRLEVTEKKLLHAKIAPARQHGKWWEQEDLAERTEMAAETMETAAETIEAAAA